MAQLVFERVAERNVSYVVKECGQPNQLLFGFRDLTELPCRVIGTLAAVILIDMRDDAFRDVNGTYRVLETRVGSAGKDQVCKAQLACSPQTLKGGMIDHFDFA